ncbi:hypothetical protein BN3590_00782 [Clostridium sp. C105KSO15]|nr:hypothetical protein BN3590_00782 [Clostridium sp. C105KSO15]
MNIFEHRSSFFGKLDNEITNGSLLSLFSLITQIRLRLGKQGYLLDCYLSLIFEGVSAVLTYNAADDGFMKSGEFQSLCFHVLDGTEPEKPHPLYQRIRDVYERQTEEIQSFQERYTQVCLLMFYLEDELLAYATGQFIEEQVKHMDVVADMVRLQELYDQITQLVGEPAMEDLNQRLKGRFMITTLTTVFAQGFTDELLDRLSSRDPETSRQMFQLFIDNMPDTLV